MKGLKNHFVLLVMLTLISSTLFISSCTKDDEDDKTNTITATYTGQFNSSGFQSTDYTVKVKKVDNTTVKIIPEDDHGTPFEATVVSVNDVAVSCDAGSNTTILFTSGDNGKMHLNYNYNFRELFTGVSD